MVDIGPMSSVWVTVEWHHEGLEVRSAGVVDLMDFRTRHKVIISTALLLLRVPCVGEIRSDVLVKFQVASVVLSVCVPPWKLQTTYPKLFLWSALWRLL